MEYRVWCENGDLIGEHTDRLAAEAELEAAIATCPCGGEYDCGVLFTHGYHIQEVED